MSTIVDATQAEPVEAKPSWSERRAARQTEKARAAKLEAAAKAAAPPVTDDALMSVPAPGQPNKKDGRRTAIATRAIVISALSLAALGSCGVGSYVGIASTRAAVNRSTVTTGDLTGRYHLATWDQAAGAAFATRYLNVCLARYPQGATDPIPQEETNRATAFQSMAAGVQDQSCEGTAPTTTRTVTSVTYTGKTTAVSNLPGARYVNVQAGTSDGLIQTYTVPVWFSDPETGQGPRVVGPIGMIPVTKLGVPNPDSVTARTEDNALAASLKAQFAPQFFTAWAASSPNLSQFLTPTATATATTGLGGKFKTPTIQSVTVFPEKSTWPDTTGGAFKYKDRSTADMDVTVSMVGPGGNVTSGAGYRLSLVQTAGRWFVQDVQAGAISQLAATRPATNGNPGNVTTPTSPTAPAVAPATPPKPSAPATPKPTPKPTKKK